MGKLMDALSPVSSYAAKKTDIWDQITTRIAGAWTPHDLEEVEAWLLMQGLHIPSAWEEPIIELLEKRAEELRSEDIGLILRDRFDF